MKTQQLEIDFEPGLTEKYATWWECVKAAVANAGNQKQLAMDLDMSPSEFSRRMVSQTGDLIFHPEDIDRLLALLARRGELRPVMWMVERFLSESDDDVQKKARRLVAELQKLMPQIVAVIDGGRAA